MLLFILFLVFGIIFIVAGAILDENTCEDAAVAILMFFGCACLTGALVSGLEMAFAKSEAKNFIERKEFYDDLLANISENASSETICEIVEKVKNNNETILRHRVLDNNVFVGRMYRPEVAELELTEIPELQIKKYNNELQQP